LGRGSTQLRDARCSMISTSSLVLDGPHGLGPSGPHHLSFVEPYLRAKMPSTEFLRPLPKPAPMVPRYNGRPPTTQSPRKDFLPPTSCPSSMGPVNLAKDADAGFAYSSRLFPHPGFFSNPYSGLYPSPYPSVLTRPTYINHAPIQLEAQYTPPHSSPNNPAFRSPNDYAAPPQPPPVSVASKPAPPAPAPVPPAREKKPFKVPPGREPKSKSLPLRTKRPANHNNNTLPPYFTKGSLIQLGNGELRRVEDVTAEDLVSSAERCAGFRLDPSTVVRIEESSSGMVVLSLSPGENKRTVSHSLYSFCMTSNSTSCVLTIENSERRLDLWLF